MTVYRDAHVWCAADRHAGPASGHAARRAGAVCSHCSQDQRDAAGVGRAASQTHSAHVRQQHSFHAMTSLPSSLSG